MTFDWLNILCAAAFGWWAREWWDVYNRVAVTAEIQDRFRRWRVLSFVFCCVFLVLSFVR